MDVGVDNVTPGHDDCGDPAPDGIGSVREEVAYVIPEAHSLSAAPLGSAPRCLVCVLGPFLFSPDADGTATRASDHPRRRPAREVFRDIRSTN